MRSVKFALVAFASFAVTTAVSAQQDYEVMRPALWSGFYAGLHGGWGEIQDSKLEGFTGGGHVGYNVQNGFIVTGVEGDLSYSDISYGDVVNLGPAIGPVHRDASLDYLASIRGRIGVTNTSGTALFYATAGYAFSEISATAYAPQIGASLSLNEDLHGLVAGGGMEYQLSSNLSGRVEALHYWLGPDGTQSGGGTVVRAGLSYRFGGN